MTTRDAAATAGSDLLQLHPSVAPARGLTSWLAGELRSGIRDGRLPPGSPLPASRVLAADLGISRGIVVEAYQRLADEGLVSADRRAGTRVLGLGIPPRPDPGPVAPPRAPGPDGETAPPQLPLSWRLRPEIDLSPGVPDLSAFPRTAWLRAERSALAQASAAELGYGDPRGSEVLRAELSGWLSRTRGVRAGPEDIMIVSGVAQAIALLARTLFLARGPGVRIAVEDPGSRGARDELAYWGLEPVPIPVDDQGVVVSDLDASGASAALLTPAHQFPTGVVLGPGRRRELLDWASAGNLVIEDDYDAEYRYDRAPVPALQAFAPDHVAHAGSVSKTLAPGLRLGWLVAPRQLRPALTEAKHAADIGSPALPQLTLARLIACGDLEGHIRLVRKRQRDRRDALLAALRDQLPSATVQGVAAGLHLLITFPDLDGRVDDEVLAREILTAGVLVQALSLHRVRTGPPGLIVGYAAQPPDRLREAGRRIAGVIRRYG